jgi:hypothetical protein
MPDTSANDLTRPPAPTTATSASLDLNSFGEPGLYLLFPDGNRLDLTRRRIDETTQRFLGDPNLIPDSVKAATQYAPCSICPENGRAIICHALMPTLPFVEEIDRYLSYAAVTAVYREDMENPVQVSHTNMQRALVYVSMLSLIQFCEVGRTFAQYFEGVNPLMAPEKIARQVFANLHVGLQGDLLAIESLIQRMSDELHITTTCQMARIRLISRNDAFLNAFVNANCTTGWLSLELQTQLDRVRQSAVGVETG